MPTTLPDQSVKEHKNGLHNNNPNSPLIKLEQQTVSRIKSYTV